MQVFCWRFPFTFDPAFTYLGWSWCHWFHFGLEPLVKELIWDRWSRKSSSYVWRAHAAAVCSARFLPSQAEDIKSWRQTQEKEGGVREGWTRGTAWLELRKREVFMKKRRRESTEKLRLHVTFGGSSSVMERARIAGKLGHFFQTYIKLFQNRMILIWSRGDFIQGKQQSAKPSLLIFAVFSLESVCLCVCLPEHLNPLWFMLSSAFVPRKLTPQTFPILSDCTTTAKLLAKCTSAALIWKNYVIPSLEWRLHVTEDFQDWGNLISQCKVAVKCTQAGRDT